MTLKHKRADDGDLSVHIWTFKSDETTLSTLPIRRISTLMRELIIGADRAAVADFVFASTNFRAEHGQPTTWCTRMMAIARHSRVLKPDAIT
jgi:hypothetical protein